MSTATEQPISRYGANMEHKDKYITLLQEQVKEEQREKKELQSLCKKQNKVIESCKVNDDYNETKIYELENEVKEKEQCIEDLLGSAEDYRIGIAKERAESKALEEHNKELIEMINEMMYMIKVWHCEDKRHMETTIHSREHTASRYERDLNKVLNEAE